MQTFTKRFDLTAVSTSVQEATPNLLVIVIETLLT